MIPNNLPIDLRRRPPEIQAIPHRRNPAHSLVRRPVAGLCRPEAQPRRKSSAGNRRKLTALIDHAYYRIRKDGTQYPIDDNSAYRHFPVIRFSTRLAVDDIGQQIEITLLKIKLRNIK